ncbi:MAG: hypothetical protein ACK4RK_09560 [Gemmataceae bacterium]
MNDLQQLTLVNGEASGKQKPQPKTVPLQEVIAEVVRVGVHFLVNTKNEPVVFLPDTPFQQYWPAGHDRVESYLAAIYHDLSHGGYLKSAEQAAVVALLKDACYKGGRRFTELESPEAEKEPIIQALLYFVNNVESFDGMTATLLSKLNEPDIMRKVRGIEDFPILTNIFSRRLNRLTPVLRGLGIEVSIWHEEDGSHCTLKRLPNFVKETDALTRQSSANPSVANPKKGNDFKPADGTDGTERFDVAPAKTQAADPVADTEQSKTEVSPTLDNQVAVEGGAA